MILTLALRELRKSWGALLQAGSLAVAVATLAASFQLSSQVSAQPVAGSSCGEDVLALSWASDRGDMQEAFSPRQAQALVNAMAGTLSSQVVGESTEVSIGGQKKPVGMAYVEPQYFRTTCARRIDAMGQAIDTPFLNGLVIEQSAARAWDRRAATVQGIETGATSSTQGFTGMDFTAPVRAFAPFSAIKARGDAYMAINAPMVKVLLRLREGEKQSTIEAKLETARKQQSTLFADVARIRVGAPLQVSAQTAMKIGRMSVLLRVFAAVLLLLVLVNLSTYHMGRMSQAQSFATTLAALGVPPRHIALYAGVEPVAVGLVAWMAGTLLALPLGLAAMEVAGLQSGTSQPVVGMAWTAGMVVAITLIITLVRVRVLRRRGTPNKGKGKRLLLKLLPLLLGVQVALAATTLVVAAQAAIGLVRALPPAPNFPLDGLTVLQIDRGDMGGVVHNTSMQWDAAWREKGRVDYRAALATDISPFLPNGGFVGTLTNGPRSVQAGFSYVTPNFFQILGTQQVDASAFATDPDDLDPATKGQANHLVLNTQARQALFPNGGEAGTIVRYTHRDGRTDPSQMRSTVIVGEFDDGIVGARGAVGTMDMNQLSMQASLPTVYQPLSTVYATNSLLVFVRHPLDQTSAQVMGNMLPAVQDLFPGARLQVVGTGHELFEQPLRRERALALILGLLASASLGIGVLGMLSLTSMLLGALKIEMAVRVAVGADRASAARVLLKKLLVPVGVGILGAIVPAGLGLWMLSNMLETAARAGATGPILTVLCMGLAVGGMCAALLRAIRGANIMDWLRYE